MATVDPSAPAAPGIIEPAVDPRSGGRMSRALQGLEIYLPAALLLAIIFACFILPLFGVLDKPVGGSVLDSNLPVGSPGHLLGTDASGNDELARVFYGGRVSLEVAGATQLIGLALGGLLGIVAGLSRGIVGALLLRLLDVFIAFPSLVLALAIAEGLGPSELHVIWAISIYAIPAFARLARAQTLRLRELNYITAARTIGTRRWRIVVFHLAPNLLPSLLTFALLQAGVAIILEGALDFLTLGIPPPGASWGNMIADGQNTLSARPSLVIIPSIALLVTVATLNLLGDGLRQRWSAR
jgi:peptide/nickel transport system permease protein